MIEPKIVYIMLPTKGIGGSEKRFCDLWLLFQEAGMSNVKLVITKNLFNELKLTDCGKLLSGKQENIYFLSYEGKSYLKWRESAMKFVEEYRDINSVFHFVIHHPFLCGRKNRESITYTYPGSGFVGLLNWKGIFSVGLGILLSGKVDLLDPFCYDLVRRLFFWKAGSINKTPGSFVRNTIVKQCDYSEKKNWMVFLGRFEEVKQVKRFVDFIPAISQEFKKKGVLEYKFFILGYGSQAKEICSKIEQNIAYKDINIEVRFAPHPEEILKFSKIIFSLQLYNNYPSRSLIEGMLNGNIPIVTDVGNSREIVKEDFGYFVPRVFSADDISKECCKILTLNEKSYMRKVELSQNYIKENHSAEASLQYFSKLYGLSLNEE